MFKKQIDRFLTKHRDTIKDDLFAGLTVALLLIPQSLAYAKLAGLPPYFGLYASLLPPIIAALFGSSPQLSTGPIAVISLMTLSAISPFAEPGSAEFTGYAVLLAFMLGSFLLTLGLLRLGFLVSFLSHPVIYGFTNAAALIIATSQLSAFLGITVPSRERHFLTIIDLVKQAFVYIDVPTFVLGVAALGLVIVLKKLSSKIPYILIVVVLSILLTKYFNYPTGVVGAIPAGFAPITLPKFDLEIALMLFTPMITMALIGFTEAVSISQAIAIKTKERVSPNKELIGQGLANIIGSFNQSYSVVGSFSRTAINFQSGAKTWLSSFFTSFTVLITMIFFTDVLYYLPLVILSVIVIVSVFSLVDFSKLITIWYVSKYDGLAATITFLGTLIAAPELEYGVLIGIFFSIGYFLYRNTHPRVSFLSMYKDKTLHDAYTSHLDVCSTIAVVRLDAPLFFANANYFEDEVIKYLSTHKSVKYVLLVGTGINEIDATGEEMLGDLISALRHVKKDVYIAAFKSPVLDVLKKSGLLDVIGEGHSYSSTTQAVKDILETADHRKVHKDKEHCPLTKYVKTEVHHLRHHKTRLELGVHYYKKILNTKI